MIRLAARRNALKKLRASTFVGVRSLSYTLAKLQAYEPLKDLKSLPRQGEYRVWESDQLLILIAFY